MIRYAIVVFAVLGAFYGLHRVALWAERRGWIYYRKKRGGSGSLGNAFLEVQAMIEPAARHVLEERRKDDVDDEQNGDTKDRPRGEPRVRRHNQHEPTGTTTRRMQS